jgi:hypothetical protein
MKELHIVAGVSCAGKSTYIEQLVPEVDNVIFAHQLSSQTSPDLKSDTVLHYNLLKELRAQAREEGWSFQHDRALVAYLSRWDRIRCTLLVAETSIILKRARARKYIETMGGVNVENYPNKKWVDILCGVPQSYIVPRWLLFADQLNFKVNIYDTSNTNYTGVSRSQVDLNKYNSI